MSDITAAKAAPHWLSVAPAVSQALAAHQPVVAFETTVLSFGLPYPSNMEVATLCEKLARDREVTPATLGLVNGTICVGLPAEGIEQFCRANGDVTKINLQNLATASLGHRLGAFTVAASLQVCHMAGIPVFVTGGIGGVHRDYAQSHDISSDLLALSRYPVAVVCAGIKSILDVPATLEHLETLGVPVIGYKADRFPLFHARDSNIRMETNVCTMDEVATIARRHWDMGGKGVLVVTPVPEAHAVPSGQLEEWIASATRAAQVGRVTGKAVTPFLLQKLEEISHGRSITTNVALLENNAKTGACLAKALAKLK